MSKTITFEDLITKISKESHGVESLKELKTYLTSTYNKTQKANDGFLESEFTRDPIRWEDVKDTVWGDDARREANRSYFLQGDIISTSKVLRLGTSEYNQKHELWIVRSPSCDCVRGKYIKVSPIVEILDKSAPMFIKFKTALFFSTPNRFPLPKTILDDGTKREGFYVDLIEPFFLEEEDKQDVVVQKSLSANGWHLFNAVSVNLESRADLDEELKFRS